MGFEVCPIKSSYVRRLNYLIRTGSRRQLYKSARQTSTRPIPVKLSGENRRTSAFKLFIFTYSVFETTIRWVGGLLSAYELTDYKYPVLLEKARQIGDKLVYAWSDSYVSPSFVPEIRDLTNVE